MSIGPKVVFVPQDLPPTRRGVTPNSIFLAGPTPRDKNVQGWRQEALEILEEAGYTGYVFVPQDENWGWCGDYQRQVEWEWQALGRAERVLFWVPRNLENMPAFTTNVEFGFMAATWPDRVVLGFPEGSPKNRYLASIANGVDKFATALGLPAPAGPIPVHHDLRSALLHGV